MLHKISINNFFLLFRERSRGARDKSRNRNSRDIREAVKILILMIKKKQERSEDKRLGEFSKIKIFNPDFLRTRHTMYIVYEL